MGTSAHRTGPDDTATAHRTEPADTSTAYRTESEGTAPDPVSGRHVLPADADEAADPRRWLSARVLVLVALVLAVALVVTLVVALVSWHTPALTPIDIPTAPSA